MTDGTYALVLVAILSITSCRGPVIEGRVLDGFGQPVEGATLEVIGTQFSSLTDRRGEYAIAFVPGEVTVAVSKEGYTDTTFVASIATESRFPAAPVTIWQIPSMSGMFVMINGTYVPLSQSSVGSESVRPLGLFTTSETTTYSIAPGVGSPFYNERDNQILDDEIVTLPAQDSAFRFFDTAPADHILLGVEGAVVDGAFLTRTLNNGDLGFAMGDYRDSYRQQPEVIHRFEGGEALRISQLGAGLYVFASYEGRARSPIRGDVYVLRVIP